MVSYDFLFKKVRNKGVRKPLSCWKIFLLNGVELTILWPQTFKKPSCSMMFRHILLVLSLSSFRRKVSTRPSGLSQGLSTAQEQLLPGPPTQDTTLIWAFSSLTDLALRLRGSRSGDGWAMALMMALMTSGGQGNFKRWLLGMMLVAVPPKKHENQGLHS